MKTSACLIAALLAGASAGAVEESSAAKPLPAGVESLLQGRFDNRDQIAKASQGEDSTPHVVVTIEPTSQKSWTLWRVHVETDPQTTFDQTWAMRAETEYDGSTALVPYYQLKQTSDPDAATFDPAQWLSLEACALRGKADAKRIDGESEGEPCVAVSMGVGARRALLPVGFDREGDWLHVDMNLRGVRTRIDTRRM